MADADRLNAQLSEAIADADRQAEVRRLPGAAAALRESSGQCARHGEGEPEVIEVIERSFSSVLPGAPVELLLADNRRAPASHGGRRTGGPATELRCGLTRSFPAARRAQIQEFADSDHLDACPKLRNRPEGRTLRPLRARLHNGAHGRCHPRDRGAGATVDDNHVDDLGTLAKLAGARIGLLRVMAETQLQASTDTLTGLLNRRSFSERVAAVPEHLYPVAMAMADLDHFKELNDTYGHETGDRALRLFARVLRDTLRASDVASRTAVRSSPSPFRTARPSMPLGCSTPYGPNSTPLSPSPGSPNSRRALA